MYKSMWCPKPACGSPMDPHYHQGEHKMRCSKRKCRKITPVLVSVYFHTKGIPHIAHHPHVRFVHTHTTVCPSMHSDSASQQPLCTTLHCRPTGNQKGGATSYRTQAEIAMCFAWGTVTHCTHVHAHHPSHCLGASRCHMRIATHQHMQSPSATLLVCSTLPHAYCCTLAHTATGSTSHRCQQLSGALTAGLYITA